MLLSIFVITLQQAHKAAMKIHIDIYLQPSDMEELKKIARFISNIDATLNAIELEIESYRRRLERVEEMTTRFESSQQES